MPSDVNLEIEQVSHYAQIKDLAIKQGWITVSLAQRMFRLGYGQALSIIQALEQRGIIGPAGQPTGRRLIIHSATTAESSNLKVITKADIPSFALQTLGGLLDQPGTILHSSHETLQPGKIYLMGLGPRGNGGATLRQNISQMLTVTENAYLDEVWVNREKKGNAPFQQRIQWILKALGADTRDVLATNLIFTQVSNNVIIAKKQAQKCWPIHEAMLKIVESSVIVSLGNSGFSPYSFLHSLFGGEQKYHPAGRGNWCLKRFQTRINDHKITVIGLPHLHRYQPIGTPFVEAWLKDSMGMSCVWYARATCS